MAEENDNFLFFYLGQVDNTQQQVEEVFVISTFGGKNRVRDSKEVKLILAGLSNYSDLKIASTPLPSPVVRGM